MSEYSFIDCVASIEGPGGSFDLGYGAAVSEEGITVVPAADKNTMAIGADGKGMHSLHADKSGQVTLHYLKNSPTNTALMNLYNYQIQSASRHGQNVIVVRNSAMGNSATCVGCAFRRLPDFNNAKDGGIVTWVFDAIEIDEVL